MTPEARAPKSASRKAPASRTAASRKPARVEVEVDGRTLSLSNLDKPLYPGVARARSKRDREPFTKAQIIDYYRRIAPVMLPHLARRGMTLVRFPDGADRPGFFEKNCPDHRPDWVETAPFQGRSSGDVVVHCLVDDLPTLVWLANLAALELHAPMATVDRPEHPTTVVFDLDPGPPAALAASCAMAVVLRDVLDALGLAAFPKTSGKKGVHVYVPLNRPSEKKRPGRGGTAAGRDLADQKQCQDFAHAVADLMARRHPNDVVTAQKKELRTGKVLVDWSQNTRHKTTVAPYSLRAGDQPTVSTPVTWDEVAAVADGADPNTLRFHPDDVIERVAEHGDLFEPVIAMVQELPARGSRAPT